MKGLYQITGESEQNLLEITHSNFPYCTQKFVTPYDQMIDDHFFTPLVTYRNKIATGTNRISPRDMTRLISYNLF